MSKQEDKSNEGHITTPHDHFFKSFFVQLPELKAFIQGTFPREILDKLDLDSLEQDTNSYIDKNLKAFSSDIVFRCQYGEQQALTISLLLEHKSYVPSKPIHFQLLRYMLNIWDGQENPLPIIPVVVYHGVKKWQSKDLLSYFKDLKLKFSELSSFIPQFDYLLINLQASSDEKIKQMSDLLSLQVALLLMKKIFAEELIEELPNIFAPIQHFMKSEKGRSFFRLFFLYLLEGSRKDNQTIIDKIMKISTNAGTEALSAADQLRLEGMEEGIQKGIQKEKKEVIINLLKLEEISHEKIAQVARVDLATVKEIQKELGLT